MTFPDRPPRSDATVPDWAPGSHDRSPFTQRALHQACDRSNDLVATNRSVRDAVLYIDHDQRRAVAVRQCRHDALRIGRRVSAETQETAFMAAVSWP